MKRTTHYKSAACIVLLLFTLTAGSEALAAQKRLFATPAEAAKALAEAIRTDNMVELYAILGQDSKPLVESGDPQADAGDRAEFSAAYDEKNALVPDSSGSGRYMLEIGPDNWVFPVPLAIDSKNGRWFFDGKEGAAKLLERRIGHNELSAMQVCLAYVDAQREYRQLNPQKSATAHFAAQIASRPGQRDGLYWESAAGEAPSPLGALVATAETGGYRPPQQGAGMPYYGYRYRVLTRQGKNAPGGARDYMRNGQLSEGFALLAYPDQYGVSGVMTFVVNQDGVVYEKNLGKDTAAMVSKITAFDPDSSWRKAETP